MAQVVMQGEAAPLLNQLRIGAVIKPDDAKAAMVWKESQIHKPEFHKRIVTPASYQRFKDQREIAIICGAVGLFTLVPLIACVIFAVKAYRSKKKCDESIRRQIFAQYQLDLLLKKGGEENAHSHPQAQTALKTLRGLHPRAEDLIQFDQAQEFPYTIQGIERKAEQPYLTTIKVHYVKEFLGQRLQDCLDGNHGSVLQKKARQLNAFFEELERCVIFPRVINTELNRRELNLKPNPLERGVLQVDAINQATLGIEPIRFRIVEERHELNDHQFGSYVSTFQVDRFYEIPAPDNLGNIASKFVGHYQDLPGYSEVLEARRQAGE